MLFRTVLLLMLFTVAACANGLTVTGSPDFCAAYRPVPTLYCGSESQKLAIDQNNAVYDAFCD